MSPVHTLGVGPVYYDGSCTYSRGGSCTRTMMGRVHTLGWVLYLYYDESCTYSRGGSCTRTMMGPVHTLGGGSVLVLR